MKKIFIITFITVLSLGCKVQQSNQAPLNIISIQDHQLGSAESNDYLKDTDNLLNPYVGTWLYTNGTTSLKIILKKAVNHNNGYYREDILYGEYQYIENGITKIDGLSRINMFKNKEENSINGNQILLKNDVGFPCRECNAGETRVQLFIINPHFENSGGSIYLRSIAVNNQPAISAFIYFDGRSGYQDPNLNIINQEAPIPIPQAFYTLIKQ